MPTLQERQKQEQEALQKEKEELQTKTFVSLFDKLLNTIKEKEIIIERDNISCTFNSFGHLVSISLLHNDVSVEQLKEEAFQIVTEYHQRFRNLGAKFITTFAEKVMSGFDLLIKELQKTQKQDESKINSFTKKSNKITVKGFDYNRKVMVSTNMSFTNFQIELLNSNLTSSDFINCFAEAYFNLSKEIYAFSKKILNIFGDKNCSEEQINNMYLQQNNDLENFGQNQLQINNQLIK